MKEVVDLINGEVSDCMCDVYDRDLPTDIRSLAFLALLLYAAFGVFLIHMTTDVFSSLARSIVR